MKELGLVRIGDRLKLENLISNYKENADANELSPPEPPAEIIGIQPVTKLDFIMCTCYCEFPVMWYAAAACVFLVL